MRITTGMASSLKLEADRAAIHADGSDLAFVTISLRDAKGDPVPTASPLLRFRVEGAGDFVAADNGDATDLRTFSEPQRNAFNGFALVIVRAKRGASGPIQLTVESEGLPAAKLTLSATP
jgi:beta-galactosidase